MAFTLDVEPAAFIYLDLFPAKISVHDGYEFQPKHEEYRVIVTDNRIYIIDDFPDGPEVAHTQPLIGFEGTNKTGYTVTTPEVAFHVERALNCGCGSRLRGLHPFSGVPYVSQLGK
jgi:hypothetical protein